MVYARQQAADPFGAVDWGFDNIQPAFSRPFAFLTSLGGFGGGEADGVVGFVAGEDVALKGGDDHDDVVPLV